MRVIAVNSSDAICDINDAFKCMAHHLRNSIQETLGKFKHTQGFLIYSSKNYIKTHNTRVSVYGKHHQ